MRTYKTIDLFAGIGGIRRGFEMTGRYRNVLSAEIDAAACRTYEHLYGENPHNDVTTEEFKHKVQDAEYDVLLGGFPCQAFSSAGKRLGFKDRARGTLFFDVADILDRTRPRAFLLENVKGLLFHDEGRTFYTISDTLVRELGYIVVGIDPIPGFFDWEYRYSMETLVRNTASFGIPQMRNRVYLMGFDARRYQYKLELLPRQLPDSGREPPIWRSLGELLETRVDYRYYLSQSYWDYISRIRCERGFEYIVLNLPGKERGCASTIMTDDGKSMYRNLVYDPQDIPSELNRNTDCIRRMTPMEYGRLQGFVGHAFVDSEGVDHFSFPDGTTESQKYKMFGNAVSVPVINEMAVTMAHTLDCLDCSSMGEAI